jgi:hypothetical protein
MTQKITYAVPYGVVTDDKSNPTYAWHQWADQISKAVTVIQEAALLMDDLNTGTATTIEIATAWDELRVKLQELV